jgi:hypothetical protein
MEKQVQRSLIRERLVSTLATGLGMLADVLAHIGLYRVLAYAVTRRTSEIGIRIAVGTTKSGSFVRAEATPRFKTCARTIRKQEQICPAGAPRSRLARTATEE